MTSQANHNLAALAEAAFHRLGDYESLVFEGQTYRSGELFDRASRVGSGLVKLGVSPGERVVVLMANCPEVGITYSAIWRAGAVVTPVVFLVSPHELQHILADSAAVAVVTTPELLATVTAAAAGAPQLRHVIVVGGEAGALPEHVRGVDFAELESAPAGGIVPVDDDDLAALMYTGGTTGRAKGVMLSHRNLYYCSRSSHEASQAEGITRALTPAMIQMLLAQPLEDTDLSSLRYVNCGAAPLAPETREQWERRVPGSEILEGYGCTESGAVISVNPPGGSRPGSCGRPIPGYQVSIRDNDDADVPVGTDGEICVRSDGVMAGYWNSPVETSATLLGGWLHTGDIGRLDTDGYLYVVDRKKDLIIRGGFNVFPRDVEDVLLQHPAVAMAGVVGRPDERLGEEIVAFVSLRPGGEATPAEITEFARERLAAHKYPRDVTILDAVPLTSVGKLDRKSLRNRVR